MKKILIIILIIIGAYLFKIPEYKELNNIAIIKGIAIEYDGYNYTIYLKEVIPIKNTQGIDYEYKYYIQQAASIEKAYKELSKNTKKKLYINKCQFLISNLNTTKEIIKTLKIKPKTIYHDVNNIYEKLKDIN